MGVCPFELVAIAAFHPSTVMLLKGVVAAAESNRLFRLICTDERTGALSRISLGLLATIRSLRSMRQFSSYQIVLNYVRLPR